MAMKSEVSACFMCLLTVDTLTEGSAEALTVNVGIIPGFLLPRFPIHTFLEIQCKKLSCPSLKRHFEETILGK